MPKDLYKIQQWLYEVNTSNNYPFEYNSSTIWCKCCEKTVHAEQKSQLKQHKETEKHRLNSRLKSKLGQSPVEVVDVFKPDNFTKIYKWLSEINSSDNQPFEYNSSSKTFWCKVCEKSVHAEQKSQLLQHKDTEKHRLKLGLKRKLVQSKLDFSEEAIDKKRLKPLTVSSESVEVLPEESVEVLPKQEPKQIIPWGVENLDAFLFYCCPECDEKYKDCQTFVDHAIHAHDSAQVTELENSIINKRNVIKKEIMEELSDSESTENSYDEDFEYDNNIKEDECESIDLNILANVKQELIFEEPKAVTEKPVSKAKYKKWLSEFNTSHNNPFEYNIESQTFWCKPCKKTINAAMKSQLQQHKESKKHCLNHASMKQETQPEVTEDLIGGNTTLHVEEISEKLNQKIKCDKCDHISKNDHEHRNHLHVHRFTKLIDGRFQCNECNKILDPDKKLNTHKHYNCDICSYTCTGKEALERHKHAKHSIEVTFRFLCDKCDFKTMTKTHLQTHQEKVHEGKTEVCPFCGKNYKDLPFHMKNAHGEGTVEVNCDICHQSMKASLLYSHRIIKHQHCICTICKKFFANKRYLCNHYSTEHQIFCLHRERFACHICKQPYKTIQEIQRHLKEEHHLLEDHHCTNCELAFSTNTLLAIHLMDFHEYKEKDAAKMLGFKVIEDNDSNAIKVFNYSCDVCLKKFHDQKSLKRHHKRHHENHAIKCDQCDFTTNEDYRLKIHILRKHEEATKYPCELCSYVTNMRPDFDLHLKQKHGGKKDHECSVCGKCFVAKNIMAKHMLNEHKVVL